MYVHFGKKPFGKCDVVPELFYVATFFFHINYIPLIPLGSFLILRQTGKQYQAVRIPFSFKSFLYAWSRAIFLVAGVISWLLFFIAMSDRHANRDINPAAAFIAGVLTTAAFLFVMIYPRMRRPSYQRACELARHAKLNDIGWAALNVLHGRDPFDRPAENQSLNIR